MSRSETKFEFCFKGSDRQLDVIRSVSFSYMYFWVFEWKIYFLLVGFIGLMNEKFIFH